MKSKQKILQIGAKSLIVNSKKEFLILKRSLKKYSEYPKKHNLWDIPGGRICNDEGVEKGLKREIFEETGISRVTHVAVLGVQDIDYKDFHIVRLTYISRVTSKYNIKLSDEHESFKWVSLSELARIKEIDLYLGEILKDKNIMSFIKNVAK